MKKEETSKNAFKNYFSFLELWEERRETVFTRIRKEKKGISVIALIITIIVLILIASITIYTGGNMIDQSRIRTANDRMSTVANAIVSHEKELGFTGVVMGSVSGDYRLLDDIDYEIMGLKDYSNEEQMPPIYVYKGSGDSATPNEKVYKLKTPKIVRTKSPYQEDDFVYQEYRFYEEHNTVNEKVEFDTVKGVNRPLLTSDMMAVHTYYDIDGNIYSNPVSDIYGEDWYDYSTTSPNWANIKMNDNRYYVWIPRFAYKVQDFYVGTDYANIPSSAISVVFLKGTTNYMANDEVLPGGYQVHPAFQYKDTAGNEINLPGFWVGKYNVNDSVDVLYKVGGEGTSILGAMEEIALDKLHPTASASGELESHLLKNTEWAAVAYLSFATDGRTTDGTSIQNNPSAVLDLNVKEFVAAGLESEIPSSKRNEFDRYTIDDDTNLLSYDTVENKLLGDAIIATSTGGSGDSAWFGGGAEMVSTTEPYFLRGIDNCLFSYSSVSRNPGFTAGCRNVLVLKSSIETK